MPSERLGQVSFWLVFGGFNLAFFPMHVSGLLGMPRRVYTYPSGTGWGTLNLISTIGAYVLAIGLVVVGVNIVRTYVRGVPAGDDPWGAHDARVGDVVAAAAVQLRDDPDRPQRGAAVGRPLAPDERHASRRAPDRGDVAARGRSRARAPHAGGVARAALVRAWRSRSSSSA